MSVGGIIYDVAGYAVFTLECLLCILFIPKYKFLDTAGKWLYYYIIASTVLYALLEVLRFTAGNNIWGFTIGFLIQFIVLTGFYYLVLENLFIKRLIKVLTFMTAAVFLLDFFWWHGFFVFNTVFISIRTGLLMVYGVIYLFQLSSERKQADSALLVSDLPNFWFNAGLFIHHSSSFLFSLTYNSYMLYPEKMWLLRYVAVMVFIGGFIEYMLIYIGWRKVGKRPVKGMKT